MNGNHSTEQNEQTQAESIISAVNPIENLELVLSKLDELLEMKARVDALYAQALRPLAPEPPDEHVGVEYVARVYNCSVMAVMRGRHGTDLIPLVQKRPRKYLKSAVDRAVKLRAAMAKTTVQKADALTQKPKRLIERSKTRF